MKRICVVGVGYVGLVTAACFADLGNNVLALDVNKKRIENLNKGILPIYEPGLEELVARNVRANRLTFTTSYPEALEGTEFAFIAVATPSGENGEADLKYVAAAAKTIAETMTSALIIINKSTVPVGTGDWVADIVKTHQPAPIPFAVVSCPEFLREGTAISDFMQPHRTVLGSFDHGAAEKVAQLHLPLRAPIVITDLRTAEMIKYASNAFLATKISFINEIADICEALGADVKEVAAGMGYDKRIGPAFLDAGLGWGGSCFPKDVKALAFMAEEKGVEPRILNTVTRGNYDRRVRVVNHVMKMLGGLDGKTVGMLGLAFKPNTDDIREAASIDIAHGLIAAGAKVRAYDPVATENARGLLPDVEMYADPYLMAADCHALMVITEWNEFKQLDLERIRTTMKTPVLFDGRNIYNPDELRSLGFILAVLVEASTENNMPEEKQPPVCDYEGSDYQTRFWEKGGRQYEDRCEAIAIQRLLPKNGSLMLELGAGAGRNTLRYEGFERVVLLDYSRTQLKQAQERLGRSERFTYVAADIYRLPFIGGLFDAATMIRVLHHMADAPAALGQIRKVLQPGAVFILEFANKQNGKAILRYMLHRQTWSPFDLEPVEFAPLNFDFHPKAMQRWLNEAGFQKERILTVSHFRVNLLKRIIPPALLAGLDSLFQWTGALWQVSPSIFVRARGKGKSAPIKAPRETLSFFKCPECGQTPLAGTQDQISCPACKRKWNISDGIYDFRGE